MLMSDDLSNFVIGWTRERKVTPTPFLYQVNAKTMLSYVNSVHTFQILNLQKYNYMFTFSSFLCCAIFLGFQCSMLFFPFYTVIRRPSFSSSFCSCWLFRWWRDGEEWWLADHSSLTEVDTAVAHSWNSSQGKPWSYNIRSTHKHFRQPMYVTMVVLSRVEELERTNN